DTNCVSSGPPGRSVHAAPLLPVFHTPRRSRAAYSAPDDVSNANAWIVTGGSPVLAGSHVSPPSSLRSTEPAGVPTNTRRRLLGSTTMAFTNGAFWPSACHVAPPSFVRLTPRDVAA